MNNKEQDVLAILKLYELRRDEQLRRARAWFFSEFAPESAMDVIKLSVSSERESAYYRMVSSYWDMAASFVNNGSIDEKLFLEANTEHVFVYAKLEPFLEEIRSVYGEPDYLIHLEQLVKRVPNLETKLENRRKLSAHWRKANRQNF